MKKSVQSRISGIDPHIIMLKVKTRQYSEYPLHHIHSPSTLGHCSDSKAYLE